MKSSPRRALIRQLPVPSSVEKERSRYRRARRLQALRVGFRRQVKDVLFMTLGIFSAAFGLEGFLIPNAFIDGGATGIALLAVRLTELPLALLLVLVNAPFMVVA